MTQIIPAILAKTLEDYEKELKKIEKSDYLNDGWVHIDLIDNKFAPNQTIGADVLNKIPTNLKREIHLMVEDPVLWTEKLINVGVERIIAHIEVGEEKINEFLEKFKREVFEIGLALNPETSLEKLEGFKINNVLIMGVHPGFQGQDFISVEIEKVLQAKKIDGVILGVDGGVNEENARKILEAGADYLIVGSHLISGDVDENYQKIQKAIKG